MEYMDCLEFPDPHFSFLLRDTPRGNGGSWGNRVIRGTGGMTP